MPRRADCVDELLVNLADRCRLAARLAGLVATPIPAGSLPVRVCVAVSGGADSTALLLGLCELISQGGDFAHWTLHVAHLDHSLRETSRGDAEFVAALAAKQGWPATVQTLKTGDLHQAAARAGGGLAQAARQVRLRFLYQTARAHACPLVMTAHHSGDQAETVLQRIARGASLRGLSGMADLRPLDDQRDEDHHHEGHQREGRSPSSPAGVSPVWLARPLLVVAPATLRAYLIQRGQEWRDDPTNAGLRPLRNRLRHRVLPMLAAEVNPGVTRALTRLAVTARAAMTALEPQIAAAMRACLAGEPDRPPHGVVRVGIPALLGQAEFVADEVLGRLVARLGVGADHFGTHARERLRAWLANPGGGDVRHLDGGLWATRTEDVLTLRRGGAVPPLAAGGDVPLSQPGCCELAVRGWLAADAIPPCDVQAIAAVGCELGGDGPGPRRAMHSDPRALSGAGETLDADSLSGPLRVGPWRPGERMRPLGGRGRRAVADVLRDAGVPRGLRPLVLAVRDAVGIVWLAPYRLDQRVALTDRTTRRIRLAIAYRPPRSP